MKQTQMIKGVNRASLYPQKSVGLVLMLLLIFIVGISTAFAQVNMQSSAGEFAYPIEKPEEKANKDNIFLKQVDVLAGDLVGKIASVFFYPILTFEKVGDQPSEFTVKYSEGYKEGEIIAFSGGKPTDDEQDNRTQFVFRKSDDGEILELKLLKQGSYLELPTNPIKLTGGSG